MKHKRKLIEIIGAMALATVVTTSAFAQMGGGGMMGGFGSGGGMITCLASMERWIDHVQARRFDLIPVNRWSREYKLQTIQAAAHTLVTLEVAQPA